MLELDVGDEISITVFGNKKQWFMSVGGDGELMVEVL